MSIVFSGIFLRHLPVFNMRKVLMNVSLRGKTREVCEGDLKEI